MPWLGASPSRTLRGMTVVNTLSLKNARMSRATCCPRFVRSSYIVSSTPAMSSDGIERGADAAQRGDEIGEPFEREVLAVERNQHRVGGDERVQREQAERRRRVDEDVVEASRSGCEARMRRRCSRLGSDTSSISAPVRLRSAGMSDSP